ncbi:lipopolysaccharide biosynthesis protein [Flavicella marina]|uniref:lipopolysaccharide biosynthesis protein n=1 Tax=Flavicella marina TaxID=1475951 RepID=UPI001263F4F7|nr:polysaccharide biosynthesis C-terminal domain-containing protein [Flavicella marina]
MSTFKRFFKDTIIYGIAAVLPKAINVLLVRLHTSSLTTSEYSVNTSFYVWAAYFNILLTYGMETAFFRFFNSEKEKGKVVSTAFISILTTSIVALIGLQLFSDAIATFLGFSKPLYFSLLVWISILDTLIVIPFAYLRVKGLSKNYTLFRVLNIGIYAFFNLFFLWYLPKNFYSLPNILESIYQPNFKEGYIFIANLIASAVTFLCVLPLIIKFDFSFDKFLFKKMIRYAWPILIAGLAYTTNENLDKLLLEDWLGKDIMGAYAGAYKIGVIMSLFIMAFRLGAEPFFFNQADKKNAKTSYAIILKWFVIIGVVFVVSIVAYIDFIASIFLGSDEYFMALSIVPIILIANLFLGIYNNLSIWYKLTDKTRFGMYISVIGAVITIAMLFILIPKIGFIGAAWATVTAYGSMLLISYLLGRKFYPVPYDIKRISLYLLLCIGISSISFMHFKGAFLINTAFIISLIGLIAFLEQKELRRFIK